MKTNLKNVIFTDANGERIPYDGSEIAWRISAYAVIVRENKVLLVKNK